MKTHVTILGFTLVLVATLPSQTRDDRHMIDDIVVADMRDNGVVYDHKEQSYLTDVSLGGELEGFLTGTAGDEKNFLICGADGTNGKVQHWKWNASANQYSIQSTYTKANADFVGVEYVASIGKLYILDATSKSILQHTWTGTTSLPQSSWNTFASISQVAELSKADGYLLQHTGTTSTSITMEVYSDFLTGDEERVLLSTTTPLVVTRESFGIAIADVAADHGSCNEAGTSISVRADVGETVEVKDMTTGAIIGTAVVPAQSGHPTSVSVTVSTPFALGHVYGVCKSGGTAQDQWECVRRYGSSETYSDSTVIGTNLHAEAVTIGHSEYSSVCTLSKDGIWPGTKEVIGSMAVAIRGPSQPDPVVTFMGRYFVVTDLYLPAEGFVSTNGEGGVFSTLSIPNDPNLVGFALFTQFILVDGSSARVSDVIGRYIHDVADAAARSASPEISAPIREIAALRTRAPRSRPCSASRILTWLRPRSGSERLCATTLTALSCALANRSAYFRASGARRNSTRN